MEEVFGGVGAGARAAGRAVAAHPLFKHLLQAAAHADLHQPQVALVARDAVAAACGRPHHPSDPRIWSASSGQRDAPARVHHGVRSEHSLCIRDTFESTSISAVSASLRILEHPLDQPRAMAALRSCGLHHLGGRLGGPSKVLELCVVGRGGAPEVPVRRRRPSTHSMISTR